MCKAVFLPAAGAEELDGKVRKSVCLSYTTQLLLCVVKHAENVAMLEQFGQKLLAMGSPGKENMVPLILTYIIHWWKPHRDVISVLLYQTKYKTQKGETLQTPVILDKYSSSALLN